LSFTLSGLPDKGSQPSLLLLSSRLSKLHWPPATTEIHQMASRPSHTVHGPEDTSMWASRPVKTDQKANQLA
jgi:hypothetical protein